jgi:lauroyl/myristoyl acyltransferase
LGPFSKIVWPQEPHIAGAKLLWGLAADRLAQLVRAVLPYEPDPVRDQLWLETLLPAAMRRDRFHALFDVQGPEPLLATLAAGQSVLVAGFHAGVDLGLSSFLYAQGYPVAGISKDSGVTLDPHNLGVATGTPGTGAAVLKLAKAARQAPRIIYIFPDGGDGEQSQRLCLGRPVQIGRGAAALAYYGKTAVFFARNRWTGHQFLTQLIPGPLPADHGSLVEYEAAFADAAAAHMTQIIQSAPEDIGSYWTHLT